MRITCSNACPKSLGTLYCFWYSIPGRWSCRTSNRAYIDGKLGGGYKKFDQGDPELLSCPQRKGYIYFPKIIWPWLSLYFFLCVYIHIHLYVCVNVCVCVCARTCVCVCVCWCIGDLQCCVSFKCTENLLSYTHTHTHTHDWSSLAHTHIDSCLENPHGQESLGDYSLWGRKESDTTERLSTAQILFQILFPCQLLQDVEYSSLCNTLGHFWLCISYVVVCIYWGRDKSGVWNYHCSFWNRNIFHYLQNTFLGEIFSTEHTTSGLSSYLSSLHLNLDCIYNIPKRTFKKSC